MSKEQHKKKVVRVSAAAKDTVTTRVEAGNVVTTNAPNSPILQQNQANLTKALALAGPYYRLLGNALGSGRWFDVYLCGLIPHSYLPPGTPPATGCEPPKP